MLEFSQIKLKYIADIFNGNSISDDKKNEYEGKNIPYIPTKELSVEDGSINYENGLSVNEEDGFRIAPSDSVLMCIEGGSAGKKIGFTDRPVAFVNKLCCIHGTTASPKFLYHALRSKDFTEQFFLNMTGLIGGVTVSVLKNLYVTLPNRIEDQQTIADHLDRQCAQIDALIANAEQQIEKLKAYKQSIITETVTKGINPDVEMKDSGVEWIGEIPVHWSIIRKLSYVTTEGISYGIVKLYDPDDENGVKVLRCSDVLEGYICTDNIRTVTKEVSQEYSRTILSGGEVLVNVRGSLGGCSIVPNDMAGYNIAREVAKISPDVSINNKYLMYYLLSHCFVDYRTRHLAGSVYIGLNIELLSSCPIPFPELFEQQQITDYLDRKCSQIDKLIALKHQKTEKLQQYKKSLIYEYVTGKKEV